jgi:hypothetical protein
MRELPFRSAECFSDGIIALIVWICFCGEASGDDRHHHRVPIFSDEDGKFTCPTIGITVPL